MSYLGYEGQGNNPTSPNISGSTKDAASSLVSKGVENIATRQKTELENQDLQNKSRETPVGLQEAFNKEVVNVSTQVQDSLRMAMKDLESGKITLRDYQLLYNNIKSNIKTVFGSAEELQGRYATRMDRLQNGDSSRTEHFLSDEVERLRNKKLVLGEDGTIMFEDDNGKKYPSSIMDSMFKQEIDYYDLNKSLEDGLKVLTDDFEVLSNETDVRSVTDLRNNPKAKVAIESFRDALHSNPFQAAGILLDHMDGYELTMDADEAESDPKKILLEYNDKNGQMTPKLSETQENTIKEVLDARIDAGLKRKLNLEPRLRPQQATQTTINARNEKVDIAANLDWARRLFEANTQEEAQLAADGLTASIGSVLKIDVNGNRYDAIVKTEDGIKKPITIQTNNPEEFIEALVQFAGVYKKGKLLPYKSQYKNWRKGQFGGAITSGTSDVAKIGTEKASDKVSDEDISKAINALGGGPPE